jgi:hypothetical protein
MVVDERARLALHRRLEDVLGGEQALTLMEHLPPVGWADVATKHDIVVLKRDLDALGERLGLRMDALEARLGSRMDALEARLGSRMDALEARLGSRMDALEARMGGLDARMGEFDARMGEFEQRTDLKLEALEHRMLARFHADLISQTRLFVFSTIGSLATIASLAFAAARMPS